MLLQFAAYDQKILDIFKYCTSQALAKLRILINEKKYYARTNRKSKKL